MSGGKRKVIWAILILLLPVIVLGTLSATSRKPPNLGVANDRLAPCPETPNCVCTQATDDEHRIDPIAFTEPSERAVERVKAAIGSIPRMKIVEEKDHYIRAEARSLIFRFVDDVEFLIDPEAKLIHFRSASRAGRSDLGVNRRRMELIRKALEHEAAG
jgi:uncharacterized protein (DUF1499 family)